MYGLSKKCISTFCCRPNALEDNKLDSKSPTPSTFHHFESSLQTPPPNQAPCYRCKR